MSRYINVRPQVARLTPDEYLFRGLKRYYASLSYPLVCTFIDFKHHYGHYPKCNAGVSLTVGTTGPRWQCYKIFE